MNKKSPIVWLSANVFGLKMLEHLQSSFPGVISDIITLDEGSTTVMYDGVEKNAWGTFGLPIHGIKDSEGLERLLNTLAPDIVFMCGWRQMLPPSVLVLPKRGFVGFHPTLLPKGRGPSPIINSIMTGLTRSGVTMFYPDQRVDSGDIIGQEEFDILVDDDAEAVYGKVIRAGWMLLNRFFSQLLLGVAPRVKQEEVDATYFPKRTLADNEIMPEDSSETVYRKIKALSWPYRGAFLRIGGKKLIIRKAEMPDEK